MSIVVDFAGKVAVVTGAAQGIGAAAALAFAEAGAKVVVSDLKPEVESVAKKIVQDGGAAKSLVGDIGQPETCKALTDLALSAFGRLDFAFNNAGIAGSPAAIPDATQEDWDRVIRINLTSVFNCIQHQIPAMLKTGGGVIVNNSSACGVRAFKGVSVEYTVAKHGVIGLTRSVAVEHGAEGIRCLAICPGFIETAVVAGETLGDTMFLPRTPLGRIGQPEEIARVVRLLCTNDASYVNGDHILVDGGLLQT
ncbi:MAG: SDR family oxidoreductase [Deltaproteobacteria bacterium]|nr:SDR family oxidoreductase [Deltaproteobacteria bacterium]